ncbi:hypothetical protein [Amycolatopsis sp. EV170708-02-1]|uniref:hypothetical protein n=1 Tax=Amycolatopsis sp. EV170708-02-1 TaxID=2919322 RepID=UPI001F0CC103|nr:hypothetical protein [Amycolatopsis sp. EV170708-02-1]UMP03780.1 hypothetical protein MJQ72_02550 [Amycolatopsis sp. EV170708-02-1]
MFQRSGGSGNNLCQVVFADNAAAAFSSVSAANAPFTGTYKPAQALGGLAGAAADGTWKFTAVDVAGGDTGSIRSISLHINGFVQPGVAERPASVGKSVGKGR